MKGAQLGGFTDGYVLKMLHHCIFGVYRLGVLFVFPTVDEVNDFASTRLDTLIKENPRAIGQFVGTDRTGLKKVCGAYLYFRTGRDTKRIDSMTKSTSKMKSISVDAMLFDEVDEMDPDAIDKAKFRAETSELNHQAYLGNPTIPEYGIHSFYLKSDQKVWMTKCGGCGEWTCLEEEFPNSLVWNKDKQAVRICVKCGKEADPNIGEWVARIPDRSGDFSGYWIGHLSCPIGNANRILQEWEAPDLRVGNFYNMRLGLPYIAAENRLQKPDIYNLCGIETMPFRHPGPCAMGVDVQGERKGFHVIIGCRTTQTTKKVIHICRVNSLNDLYDLIGRYNVKCVVADIEPETRLMKEFAENAGIEVFLCKYKEKQIRYPDFITGEHLVTINRTEICDATNDMVRKSMVIMPRRNEEVEKYAEQMVNTAKVLIEDDETGKMGYTYRKLGQDDYYHATNYFILACDRVGVSREEEDKVKPKDAWDKAFSSTTSHAQVGFMGV